MISLYRNLCSKRRKHDINSVYEDQHSNGDEMPIDSSKSQRRSSRVRKTTDTFILSDVNTQKLKSKTQVDDSDEHGDSFARIKKSKKVDEREKIVKSPVLNEYTCLYYAMYNSLRTEKHRMAFSKGNLQHPSKAFVDFMINDQTSTEYKRRRIYYDIYSIRVIPPRSLPPAMSGTFSSFAL